MTTVSVKGKNVRIDGMQFGSTYSSHENAIQQGKMVHEKYYPQAKFEIIPEPIFVESPIAKPRKKKIAA